MIDLLSHMFLSVVDVLLAPNFKCSHFADKGICQFLIMIWCVHRLWFIENFSPRTEYEVFDDYEWCNADDWVEWVVVNKLSYKNSSESVSLKSIPPLSEIKLQKLIDIFCLIICFQMKGSWELDINIYTKTYLFSKIIDELRVIIWYNGVRSTVFLIEFNESDAVYTDSINFSHKHKCDIFWEVIHNNHHIDADLSVGIDEWR